MPNTIRRLPVRRAVATATTGIALAASAAAMAPATAAPARHTLAERRAEAPRVDVRATAAPVGIGTRTAAARAGLARSLGPMGVVEDDAATGSLRFVGRLDGTLTGTRRAPATRIALGYVRAHRAAFGLRARDLRTLHLRTDYVDALGTHHLAWVQRAGGLPVFAQGLEASVAADGRLVNVSGGPVRGLRAPAGRPRLDRAAAIAAARTAAGALAAPARGDRARAVLYPAFPSVRRAWQTVTTVSPSETDLSVVDDATGRILYRNDLTSADAAGSAEAWALYPSDLVPGGGGSEAPVAFPVFDGSALSGNNAHTFLDVRDDGVAQPRDEVPATTGLDWSAYDPPLDTTTAGQNCSPDRACTWDLTTPYSWRANLRHNAVQVYAFLNAYHDHLDANPIAFTEAAGNFQVVNATGLGSGGDPVLGQASDGADGTGDGFPDLGHVDNANMTTLPDGTSPIMQMYLFRRLPRFDIPGVPSANGGDDAEVVYHEYTHGLSGRLVTYPSGWSALDTFQSAAMGEGWSDWYALDFLERQGYVVDTAAVGDVVMGALSFAGELRSQPIDCPVSTTDPACPGTPGTGPGGYTFGSLGKVAGFPEVHAAGEIWGETLWDLRDRLGSNRTEELVTRAMELAPTSPGFLDMRDAILQADVVANGGANLPAIWDVFAARGMGYWASSRDGNAVRVRPDFSLPPDCSTDPCGTVAGTVRDRLDGSPLAGIDVALPAPLSGTGTALSAVTDANGDYAIADVPFHDYAALEVGGAGYEPTLVRDVTVDGIEAVNARTTRDWASIAGGASIVRVSRPNLVSIGCGPASAFDLSLTTGWVGMLPRHGGRHPRGPARAVVRLPQPTDVAQIAVAAGTGACGGAPRPYALRDFTIETRRTPDAPWRTAVVGVAHATGRLIPFDVRRAARRHVRAIRVSMFTNHGVPRYVVVQEISVRGEPSA